MLDMQLNRAAGAARSEDAASLLVAGLEYIAYDRPDRHIDPPISSRAKKVEARGFNHPILGRLLCPIDYIAFFDEDPNGYVLSHRLITPHVRFM